MSFAAPVKDLIFNIAPRLVSGEWTGTMILTEPQAGRDLALLRTRADRQEDGSAPGAVPIVQHPDIRRLLGQMRATTEGCRALVAFAAGCGDRGETALFEFLVPLVKGFCTEKAVETASRGVQIHGGMGFVEQTGAAQHYRDARILPIYECTTAIQANDLLGRKTLRDGGAVARELAGMVAQTEAALHDAPTGLQAVAACLTRARTGFEAVVAHLVDVAAKDPNAAYAGGVPYLMLAGNLVAGWQMARAALVAQAALARGDDSAFIAEKIATARFYAHHILPETELQRIRIMEGAPSLLDASF